MTGQLDYILFLYGVSFLLIAVVLLSRDPDPGDSLAWSYLAWFGLLQALHQWLEMARPVLPGPSAGIIRLVCMGASFLMLCEFGRRSIKFRSGRITGPWIYIPLAAACALGGLAGLNGFDAALRYCFALPGSLITGVVLFRHARTYTREWRMPLQIAAAAFFLYAPATGLIVAAASFPPASFLNAETFSAAAGFPIQVLRALCALIAAGAFYVFYHESHTWISKWKGAAFCGSVVFVLTAGFFLTGWISSQRAAELRDTMLSQTTALARMVDPEHLKALTFSARDTNHPYFVMLKDQLASYARIINRNIYTQALRDGTIVFGPETIPANDRMASPPGTVYRNPTLENYEAFGTGKPFMEGPVTDEYGTFISAFAPVLDPRSGRVLLLVGMDMDAGEFQQALVRARLYAIAPVLVLVIFLFAGFYLGSLRQRDPSIWKCRLRHIEVLLIAALGVIISAGLASLVHDFQTKARRTIFLQLAESQAGAITESVLNIGKFRLNSLSRFVENTPRLSAQEFSSFAAALVTDAAVQPLGWSEMVETGMQPVFTAAAGQNAAPDFRIDSRNDTAAPTDISSDAQAGLLFPVVHIEPPENQDFAIGYDLAAEPVCRAAMDRALLAETTTASDSVILGSQNRGQNGLFILRPVFSGEPPQRRLRGFVFAVVRLWSLLNKNIILSGRGYPPVILGMYQLSPDGPARLLAASPYPEALRPLLAGQSIHALGNSLNAVFPCFAFGKSYALAVQPGPVFLAANPALGGWLTLCTGIFITVLLSLFIGFLNNRRVYLELQVQARTAELQQQRQQIEDIIVGTHIGTWQWDLPTQRISVNECWAEIIGCKPAELPWLSYAGLKDLVHPEDLFRLEQSIQDCLTKKNSLYDCQYRMRRRDGLWVWVQDYGRVMHWSEDGRPLAMSGTHADITAAKESERVLKETLAELKRSNSDLEHFAYVASHDLQEPLRMVVSYMQLLKKRYLGSLDADADDFIGFAVEGAQRMQTLINDLLAYSRVGTRGKPFAPTDCSDVVLGALENLQITLAETGARVEYENLPRLLADESQLIQLFQNLVGNALKYRSKRTPHIKIQAELREREWLFSVADNAMGIEPRYFERIFVIFQRLHSRDEHSGTGIGLAVCKKIVERHGGIIWVESEPGTGSTFYFTLPCADE